MSRWHARRKHVALPDELAINPLVFQENDEPIPRFRLREHGMNPDAAYQIVHDEIAMDGNARLNLATFVGTWMDPQADKLYAEAFDKNMIDKDEYPQTAAIEERCVRILADLTCRSAQWFFIGFSAFAAGRSKGSRGLS
ncbi:pyridoxal-dependent decarboxylase [Sulfobacillus thermotolerans]|uniref:pyridoxal-dependent decarboxylase n=1 Tax=Sulfobacillus thermotolerans TaxID=338644 RepID=UPI003365BE0A